MPFLSMFISFLLHFLIKLSQIQICYNRRPDLHFEGIFCYFHANKFKMVDKNMIIIPKTTQQQIQHPHKRRLRARRS